MSLKLADEADESQERGPEGYAPSARDRALHGTDGDQDRGFPRQRMLWQALVASLAVAAGQAWCRRARSA